MTVKYLDAKRIQGVASDKATLLSPSMTSFCTETSGCDTQGVNPETNVGNPAQNNNKQYGYKLGSNASMIGETLVQVTLRLNNTDSATGTLGVYLYDNSPSSATKVGTLDVSTFSGTDYADFNIACTNSPTLAEDDVIWWENDISRANNGNINTKVSTSFTNPTGYTYVQDSYADAGTPDAADYGQRPVTATTTTPVNMSFTSNVNGSDLPENTIFEETDTRKDWWLQSGVWTE